jgi:CO dehydrogenase maturation factor
LLAELIENNARPTVIDMEAGLEHLTRGTAQHVETMLIVIEPYYKSMETAARLHELAHELGVRHVYTLANKSRAAADEVALRHFCQQRSLNLIAVLPEDDTVQQADRVGVAPLDHDAAAPVVKGLEEVARILGSGNRERPGP